MKKNNTFLRATLLIVAIWLMQPERDSLAEVVLDGTVGPVGQLAGPNYAVTPDLGRQVGGNLFHSFGEFNLASGESATFSGPSTVTTIIARVTGGHPSSLDGKISSTIANADLFFMNPAGLLLGPNATLELQGSFHATTADFIRFQDGALMQAERGKTSSLTSAPPAAFGFLDRTSYGPIRSQALLEAPEGKTLSLVGGELTTERGTLFAPGGAIRLTAVASAGEADLVAGALADHTFTRLGEISLKRDSGDYRAYPGGGYHSLATLDATGASGAGSVFIRAGNLTLVDAGIDSINFTPNPGGVIDLKVSDTIALRHDAAILSEAYYSSGHGSRIAIDTGTLKLGQEDERFYTGTIKSSNRSRSSGGGGDISLKADTIIISQYSYTDFYAPDPGLRQSGIYSETNGAGSGGAIAIEAGKLALTLMGQIKTSTSSTGKGGDLTLKTDELSIANQILGRYASGIYSEAFSSGTGGAIAIHTGTLDLLDSGLIRSSRADGRGLGGDIAITANAVTVSGMNAFQNFEDNALVDHYIRSGIGTETGSGYGSATAGKITLNTKTLTVADGGTIVSISLENSWGKSGDIEINAQDIMVTGTRPAFGVVSNIGSETMGYKAAGDIRIATGTLTLAATGLVNTNAWAGSQGNAGNIAITADTITISDYYQSGGRHSTVSRSGITSESFAWGSPGTIEVATKSLRLENGGIISTSAPKTAFGLNSVGNAGQISITAQEIAISGGFASATTLYPSAILSETWGFGNAGGITILTGSLNLSALGTIGTTVWAHDGNGGAITITGTTVSVAGGGQGPNGWTSSGVRSETWSEGHAGAITLNTNALHLAESGSISTDTHSAGAGGVIAIATDTLLATGGGAISSRATGSGAAGDVAVVAASEITLAGGAITTAAANGDGGNIQVAAGRLVHLDHGQIFTSVQGGAGNGGNIEIDPQYVILDHGLISANAFGGNGGNIHLTAGTYLADPASQVTASSALAISGEIRIDSPASDVGSAVALLPVGFRLDLALNRNSCAARNAENASSLVYTGKSRALPGEGVGGIDGPDEEEREGGDGRHQPPE